MYRIITFLFSILVGGTIAAQTLTIQEINKKLGKGINLGNMFEAPSETAWGNPFRDDYLKRIADLGFNHIRIPIRWDVSDRTTLSAPYTINLNFLERIKFVVDKALAENLMVVINMHHHDELFQNPDGVKPRFISQWQQISNYFKNYDQRLLFEVLNEPNTNLIDSKWNQFFADALGEIRKSNPTRGVLMGIAPWGGLSGLSNLIFPKDDYTILTIHYYEPFQFTHQGAEWVNNSNPWLGTKWENTTLERNEIISAFSFAIEFAKSQNKPIHVGEFGAYSKADFESRLKWTNFLARWFESQGMSWAYWEWSAGFGIFNPGTNQINTRLANALLNDPIYPAKQQTLSKVYESNFGANDGWSLNVNSAAGATLSRANGVATVDVTRASSDGWHVQLTQNNVPLKQNSRYLVTIVAASNINSSITNYIGMNRSPWSAYSGYKSLSLTPNQSEQVYSFVMTSPSDPAARIVFDMANKVAQIKIQSVKVEEVLESPVSINYISPSLIKIFPNPVHHTLRIESDLDIKYLQVYDMTGKKMINESNQSNQLNLSSIPCGHYILEIATKGGTAIKKIIKE